MNLYYASENTPYDNLRNDTEIHSVPQKIIR